MSDAPRNPIEENNKTAPSSKEKEPVQTMQTQLLDQVLNLGSGFAEDCSMLHRNKEKESL